MGSRLFCQIEMKPLRVKYDISKNCPNTGRNNYGEASKLHLQYISSLNINEIYPQVTALCSQVVHLCVTQRDPDNQDKDTTPSRYRPLVFRTTQ